MKQRFDSREWTLQKGVGGHWCYVYQFTNISVEVKVNDVWASKENIRLVDRGMTEDQQLSARVSKGRSRSGHATVPTKGKLALEYHKLCLSDAGADILFLLHGDIGFESMLFSNTGHFLMKHGSLHDEGGMTVNVKAAATILHLDESIGFGEFGFLPLGVAKKLRQLFVSQCFSAGCFHSPFVIATALRNLVWTETDKQELYALLGSQQIRLRNTLANGKYVLRTPPTDMREREPHSTTPIRRKIENIGSNSNNTAVK